jgi:biopolymer transport protein ExbD
MPKLQAGSLEQTELDMTPMIDMTFQLIAFFMVLLNFTKAEVDDRVKLPSSEMAKPPDAPPDHPLTLQVIADGRVLFLGDPVQIEQVGGFLDREKQRLAAENANPSDTLVIIRAHSKCPAGRVQDLIRECQKARFEKFALRASEKK